MTAITYFLLRINSANGGYRVTGLVSTLISIFNYTVTPAATFRVDNINNPTKRVRTE